MGELCEKMRGDLMIAGHSPSTTKIYLMYARQLARHHMRSPADLGRDEIREFMLHLAERQVSPCTMRQVRAALTFLYTTTLGRPVEVEHLPMKRLPLILASVRLHRRDGALRRILASEPPPTSWTGLTVAEPCRPRNPAASTLQTR